MAAKTSIEWAANRDGSPGATWNPIRARDTVTGRTGTFCVHASEGCRFCYAETFQGRTLPGNGIGLAYTAPNLARVEHYIDETMLLAPIRKRKPTTYFLSSMTDVFGKWLADSTIDRLFAVMTLAPRHTFIVVTKRAARMRQYFADQRERAERIALAVNPVRLQSLVETLPVQLPLPNVCLVVSVEDQPNAGRIIDLVNTPARWRGVSYEPAIGPLDLERVHGMEGADHVTLDALRGNYGKRGRIGRSNEWFHETGGKPALDWVICGGESGAKARPMHPEWARSVRKQCAGAGVPFFLKQWGEWIPGEVYAKGDSLGHARHQDGLEHRGKRSHWWSGDASGGVISTRVGKYAAGRLLDGVEHNARPDFWSGR